MKLPYWFVPNATRRLLFKIHSWKMSMTTNFTKQYKFINEIWTEYSLTQLTSWKCTNWTSTRSIVFLEISIFHSGWKNWNTINKCIQKVGWELQIKCLTPQPENIDMLDRLETSILNDRNNWISMLQITRFYIIEINVNLFLMRNIKWINIYRLNIKERVWSIVVTYESSSLVIKIT